MYIIQEIQVANTQVPAFLPPVTRTDEIEAESEFYLKVGYAAISAVWRHTVLMYTEKGELVRAKSYQHDSNGTTVINDNDP